ncbi:MAG TPA: DPP IV N-terminal domain-containing protein [Paludibacteraceae bacterium]|mgnify:CR=1 FL=1|jgi:dipeptidyl-peptidase-4|nr:DPP IV N-terminal domain-containing protein [Paludibacteraceae bacterium]HPH63982.1 DPP IV N-terminal domain-containing protein [Paludibacteraceae bacterium]
MKSTLKQLSPEQMIPGNSAYEQLLPKTFEQISFCSETPCIRYIFNNEIKNAELPSLKTVWTFSLTELNALLKKAGLKLVSKIPNLHFTDEKDTIFWIIIQNRILFVNSQTKEITTIIKIKQDYRYITFNEKAKMFFFVKGNGLFLLDLEGNISTVSKDKSRDILSGEIPSREEFGIGKGSFWSPNGKKLAFYITDQRQVSSYPLVKIERPISKVEMIKYPMAGSKSQTVKIGIYNLETNETIILEKSRWKESYLTCTTWSPDSDLIYLAEVDRDQKHCQVKRFSASDGSLNKILFDEKEEKYVEPQHPLFFLTDEKNLFVWQSRRDGFNHLYLYNTDGKLIHQLTKGDFEVTQLNGYDEQTHEVIYTSTTLSPLCRNVYATNIQTLKSRVLAEEEGCHNIVLSEKQHVFIDRFSSTQEPNLIQLVSLKDGSSTVLLHAEDPYKGYAIPETEIDFFDKNGEKIYYRIVRPLGMKEGKKYPLAFYVYGGPHVQLIRNEWLGGTKGFEYLMAQAGYVVCSIDPHGSDNRGKEFENAIWRNIGKPQLEDYQCAIEWLLKNKDFIDEKRMGVYGWSFGGFMATSLMLRCPDLFPVGIAGGAVTDWKFYEVMYTERYMETPQKNPDGFEENSLHQYIKNLKGKLLLMHCDNDSVVLWQNTLTLLKAAIKAGKQVDYSVYPGYPHNVQGPDRVHLMLKIRDYFNQWLK